MATSSEEAKSKALKAIHDEAVKLLGSDDRKEIDKGLNLIISIARYGFDVRSE